MKEFAFAKINLALDVTGVREDGYHDLEMVMVPVMVYDTIEINIAPTMSMTTDKHYIPCDDKNTVIKAINAVRQYTGISQNFEIELNKHIPTRAGLGGGSADAAATIRILNKMLQLNLSTYELFKIAKNVGADVPFCIRNQTSYVEGIGERLTPIQCYPVFQILLVKPKKGIGTKDAFQQCDNFDMPHGNIQALIHALELNDYDEICHNLFNSLEPVAFSILPVIAEIKQQMIEAGFDGVVMSGSGSTVVGITRDMRLLRNAERYFKTQRYWCRSTTVKLPRPIHKRRYY